MSYWNPVNHSLSFTLVECGPILVYFNEGIFEVSLEKAEKQKDGYPVIWKSVFNENYQWLFSEAKYWFSRPSSYRAVDPICYPKMNQEVLVYAKTVFNVDDKWITGNAWFMGKYNKAMRKWLLHTLAGRLFLDDEQIIGWTEVPHTTASGVEIPCMQADILPQRMDRRCEFHYQDVSTGESFQVSGRPSDIETLKNVLKRFMPLPDQREH